MVERYFYHAFPRRAPPAESSPRGLAILSSILQSGLLLTPELIRFRERLRSGGASAEAILQQKRMCFTELCPAEVPLHAATFGPFALEWEIVTFRQMGGCPVFYVPLVADADDLSGLGATILMRLGDAQTILERLHELAEAVPRMEPNRLLNVTKNGDVVANTRATAGAAADLLSFLQQGTQPVTAVLDALRSTLGLFYPTEDLEYTGLLDYYRQREWRLLANVVHMGVPASGELTDGEREELLGIDYDFFARQLHFRLGFARRVDQCQYVRQWRNSPVFSTVRRVVAPRDAVQTATELVRMAGWATPVVPLDTL
ncbi:MAG TPA: hypothetical protein VLH75_08755 [Longimicrobiales bacterium]|nr:hypothetical protein [Longimicrobiales bacterium]